MNKIFWAFLTILRVASTIQLHKTCLKCSDSKVRKILEQKWLESDENPGEGTANLD